MLKTAWCGMNVYNPDTWEAEAEGFRVKGHLWCIRISGPTWAEVLKNHNRVSDATQLIVCSPGSPGFRPQHHISQVWGRAEDQKLETPVGEVPSPQKGLQSVCEVRTAAGVSSADSACCLLFCRCPSREDFPLIETEDEAYLRRIKSKFPPGHASVYGIAIQILCSSGKDEKEVDEVASRFKKYCISWGTPIQFSVPTW